MVKRTHAKIARDLFVNTLSVGSYLTFERSKCLYSAKKASSIVVYFKVTGVIVQRRPATFLVQDTQGVFRSVNKNEAFTAKGFHVNPFCLVSEDFVR